MANQINQLIQEGEPNSQTLAGRVNKLILAIGLTITAGCAPYNPYLHQSLTTETQKTKDDAKKCAPGIYPNGPSLTSCPTGSSYNGVPCTTTPSGLPYSFPYPGLGGH